MDNMIILAKEETTGAKIEIIQYETLLGSDNIQTAQNLFFVNSAGMKLKMVKITLNNSKVRIEPGALYYMHGNLELKASTGGGLVRGLLRSAASGESLFISEIHGSGEIYLEPTFGHFFLYTIDHDEVIVDKSLFYCGTADLDVGVFMQKNVSSAIFGGEGLFQTSIKGSGIAVINSPVPQEEITQVDLVNGKLSVDGNFALMRTGGLAFRAEKSSKSIFGTLASGEGLLSTFTGTGSVWVAPTQSVYEKLALVGGLSSMTGSKGSSDSRVS